MHYAKSSCPHYLAPQSPETRLPAVVPGWALFPLWFAPIGDEQSAGGGGNTAGRVTLLRSRWDGQPVPWRSANGGQTGLLLFKWRYSHYQTGEMYERELKMRKNKEMRERPRYMIQHQQIESPNHKQTKLNTSINRFYVSWRHNSGQVHVSTSHLKHKSEHPSQRTTYSDETNHRRTNWGKMWQSMGFKIFGTAF